MVITKYTSIGKGGTRMAWVGDVAMTLVNLSIDKAERTRIDKYYMDIVKLRKLLAIAWYQFEKQYHRPLFKGENSTFNEMEKGITFVATKRGFGRIKERFSIEEDDYVIPSVARYEFLESIVNQYGLYNVEQLRGILE